MKRGYLAALLVVLAATNFAQAQSSADPDAGMRTWAYADYMLWWYRSAPTGPALLTTGPLTNPTSLGSGILGANNTQVLAGNSNFRTGPYSGFRLGAGWMNCKDTFGIDANFFYLTQHGASESFTSGAGGSPLLARPVLDARTGNQTVLFASAPGAFAGTFTAASSTLLYGYDANFLLPTRRCYACDPDEVGYYVTPLVGFRYINLRDDETLYQSTNVLPRGVGFFDGQPITNGGNISVTDNFGTLNQFYGGQIGVRAGVNWWRFSLFGTAKVALGSMREEANIGGSTSGTSSILGGTQSVPGGLLALNSNSGGHDRNMIAVLPEGNLNFSVEITRQFYLHVGYTILYVSNVARPGNMIAQAVNRTDIPSSQVFNPSVPGPHQPGFSWSGTDFWAQGFNVGFSLRF